MAPIHHNRTAGVCHEVAFCGGSQPGGERSVLVELADALYAKAELLGELERTREALVTIGELVARFGDEQNPEIRSIVVDAYELRERIVQECFQRNDDSFLT